MRAKQISGVIGFASAALLLLPGAWAGPFVTQGPFVIPFPHPLNIPTHHQVPGKEYTDFLDKNDGAPPVLTPLQNLAWDGQGGRANSFNWTGTGILGTEVDATANRNDILFRSVIANTSALLLSSTGDPIAPILVEPTSGCGGGPCPIWAANPKPTGTPGTHATDYHIDQEGVTDLDALEVWGPDGPLGDDSNRISTQGVLGGPDPGGVAVWACGAPGPCIPVVLSSAIAAAIGTPGLQIDLDALMYLSGPGTIGSEQGAGSGGADELLFSIRPVGPWDGGEIWHWIVGAPSASFLVHGGHVWDTANDVTALLGSENVDALEAVSVPEPASLALLGIGLLGLAPFVRRRRRV